MTEATVNDLQKFNLREEGGKFFLVDENAEHDIQKINEHSFHVLKKGQSFRVLIKEINRDEKEVRLLVNGKKARVKLTTDLDRVLAKLGMSGAGVKKAAFIKAPMPGMIYSLRVSEGDHVKKGDAVLILEAMKMENVIKSPSDGKINKIHVKPGMGVDKGQLLVTFG